MPDSFGKGDISKYILMGSDDGVWHAELLGFWTFSIVGYSRK
jgi:hypothetical protein